MASISEREQFDIEDDSEDLYNRIIENDASALIASPNEDLRERLVCSLLSQIESEEINCSIIRISCDKCSSLADIFHEILESLFVNCRAVNMESQYQGTYYKEKYKSIKKEVEGLLNTSDINTFMNNLISLIGEFEKAYQFKVLIIFDRFETTDNYFEDNDYQVLRAFSNNVPFVYSSQFGKGEFSHASADKYAFNTLSVFPNK